MHTRQEFEPTRRATPGWSGSKTSKIRQINFSVCGVIYTILNSRKDESKTLKGHLLKDIVPNGFIAKIAEVQEKHQRAIEDQQAVIVSCENQMQAIKSDTSY